ncbi:hypothetical protein Q4F19_12010 [Sphingomonas sp. BIUV-7]|uniref:Uncharacterized protein n=1 Tax=Sphingomonas natans TaxID=3063330 RepID=A0ABT8Y9U9_9SPHN|nr:hypothetical protein [Sphingomonas sp. BIUV-7]MDO6415106.1 hypothetical protein [Sphingomonas sp. BIUV-7]
MTGSELRDVIVRHLAKSKGGGTVRWRAAIGELKVYSLSTHGHCNWDVRPAGTTYEMAEIERAVDVLRLAHPFVDVGV